MLTTAVIPGYQLTEIIYQGEETVLYRGKSQVDDQPIILKVLKADYPTLEQITRLKHEYNIVEGLDLEGVVKVYQLVTHQNRLALVYEDFGGKSLKQLLSAQKLTLVSFLNIAIQLAQALASLHQHHIVHKDIKPANIIINPHGKVKLTDFSIASRLSKETPQLTNPQQLEGTLAYMSPEQTGRMNRFVDYRSDFYSLGVTFYEMLTGQLPFQSDDPLELVHYHIAKQPAAITQLNPEVPPLMAAIAMKLMAKNAEDRYQSATGLKADLESCLVQLAARGEIVNLIPGQLDRSGQLLIPQKLYGREQEVKTLLAAFERVSGRGGGEATLRGKSEMMLVSGYSGIGKSSLVNEVHKPIVGARGYFIAGKFDQFKRNIPYASLIQAFVSLMRQLLTEDAANLQAWRDKLQRALGANGQAVIDVIPEVELIIGQQPPLPQLGPTEAQNRFKRVFQKFIRVFTQKEHPLVIFLDDLQWADAASLKLMQLLIANPESQYLLLIGAYRDNEVHSTHPLMHALEEIQKAGTVVNHIVVKPLELKHVCQLIDDTLLKAVNSKTLAELLFNKTAGNPFFLTQMLKTLYQEQLLSFDFAKGCWRWNINQIQAVGITDLGVVELMSRSIGKLPVATQEILKLAACIGDRFKLDVLAITSEKSVLEIAGLLWSALQQGLILTGSSDYKIPLLFEIEELRSFSFDDSRLEYRFLHDRVQQAAYSLIPDDQKKATHLKIGQLLLKNTRAEELESNIFDIVNQFNFGLDTIPKRADKSELARLNFIAGRKAKLATAYEPALKYLNVGIGLLRGNAWETDYKLALELHEEATEAAYLNGDFERMQQLADLVLARARTLLEKVKVYEFEILACAAQNKPLEAIEIGLQTLRLLGVSFPDSPTEADISQALAHTASLIPSKGIEDLMNLPEMTDTYALAALRISNAIVASTFVASPNLFLLLSLAQVNLSIQHGNAPASAIAYAHYGIVLCGSVHDIESGYRFGKLALDLLPKSNDKTINSGLLLVVAGFIVHWKSHLKESLPLFQLGYQSGLEIGKLEMAGWHYYWESQASYLIGEELASLERKVATHSHAIRQIKQELNLNYNELLQQVILNLIGGSEKPWNLIGEAQHEEQLLVRCQQINDTTGLCYLYLHKLTLCYLFGQYAQAVENAALAAKYLAGVTALPVVPCFYFYDSLAQLAMYNSLSKPEQDRAMEQVATNQEKMQYWANHAPMNCLHKWHLVEAERYRVLGERGAMDYYDCAIQGAAENGYIQEEALANERAAEFYLGLGKNTIAKAYMMEAYYGYIRWGAIAKVKDLDERYPHLIIRSLGTTETTKPTNTRSTTTDSGEALDISTVIKASEAMQSEIVLENLLGKLLHIVMENAAAQKGCLILEKDNQLFIEAAGTAQQDTMTVLQSMPIEISPDLPISLVNYVKRSQQPLVLSDATQETISSSDPYVLRQQPRSVLCAPILYHRKFTGIVYLENNLATGAFTPDRLELLKLLTSQAAIALENARLYAREQEKSQQLQQSLQKLQQTQSQLVQTEKISSLGQLVAGVAHEVNNPVSFISGNLHHANQYLEDLIQHLQLYQQHYPNPASVIQDNAEDIDLDYLLEDLPKMLSSMKLGTDRIRDIMQSLRNFSRADGVEKRATDIHEGLDTTLMILQYRLKAKPNRPAIQVVKEYGDLPKVKCYAGQLNQVFMNLLSNAIDALEESSLGKRYAELEQSPNMITIHTAVVRDNIVIRIADNGPGMSEAARSRLFEPFFTTKQEGKGTGLGLAISYQIVTEKHGGSLECISTPGQGAEFAIAIPIGDDR